MHNSRPNEQEDRKCQLFRPFEVKVITELGKLRNNVSQSYSTWDTKDSVQLRRHQGYPY